MAERNAAELAAGAVVLVVALGFLGYAVVHTGRSAGPGNTLHASFDRIDGLSPGADVRVAGVKVGSVDSETIDPKSFQATVTFTVARDIQLPKDSTAQVTSDGLLGGKYLSLTPGGDDQVLADGGVITNTQSAINVEELLGKFIFSAADLASSERKPGDAAASGAPASGSSDPKTLPPLGAPAGAPK